MRIGALILICVSLTASGAVALPFRVTADAARVVPVAGDVVAAPPRCHRRCHRLTGGG